MAATLEMEALRLQNEELKAEVGRLKETRAAIYKLYLESQGTKQWIFTRAKVAPGWDASQKFLRAR